MRMHRSIFAIGLLALGGTAPSAIAQGKKGAAAMPRPAPKRPNRPQKNPVRELERFQRMSPQQRQSELSRLPPERRQQIEQRMARLQNLSPEQRQHLERRYEAYQNLPEERQTAVREELQRLRALPENQRKKRLSSDEMHEKFSPEELKLL